MDENLITEAKDLASEILNDNDLSVENREKLERIKEIMSHSLMGSTKLPEK